MAKLRIRLLFLILNIEHALSQFFNNTDEIQSHCPVESRVNLTGETPDALGFVVHLEYVFPPDSMWNEDGDIFGCDCYNRSNCLPLACPIGSSMYYQIDLECVEFLNGSDDSASIIAPAPLLYSVNEPIESVMANNTDVYMEYAYGNCSWTETDTSISVLLEHGVCARSNVTVYLPQKKPSYPYNFDTYCRCKGVQLSDSTEVFFRSVLYTVINTEIMHNGNKPNGVSVVVHVGMMVSIPFLLITFVVYLILPELKNIHGLTLMGYVGCLLVAYTTLAIIQTVGPISHLPCLFFAYTIYFSCLASFFWLHVMCFDIWCTFGGFRSFRGKTEKEDRKKFFMYSIYALGCASLLTGICMIMDLVPGISDTLIRPGFGVESNCWFKTDAARGFYFYGPIGVIITCNIIFFTLTAIKIIQYKKNAAYLRGTDNKRHDDTKQWFNLYLKLFIVMGINWSMEIISWLCAAPEYVWYITDLGNALQGLIIFVIFICKKKIMLLLVKRFGCGVPNRSSNSETVMTSISRSA